MRDTAAMGRGIGSDRVICGWHQGRSTKPSLARRQVKCTRRTNIFLNRFRDNSHLSVFSMTRIPHDSKLGACLRRTGHSAGGCGLSAEVGGHIQIGWVSVELAGSSNFWHEACHRSSEFKKEMEKLFSCRVVAHVLTTSIFGDNEFLFSFPSISKF